MLSISVSPFKRSEWLGKWSEWFKWCWQRNVGGRVISTPALRPRSPCTQSSSSTSKSKIGLKNFIFYRNQPILYHINYLFLVIFVFVGLVDDQNESHTIRYLLILVDQTVQHFKMEDLVHQDDNLPPFPPLGQSFSEVEESQFLI